MSAISTSYILPLSTSFPFVHINRGRLLPDHLLICYPHHYFVQIPDPCSGADQPLSPPSSLPPPSLGDKQKAKDALSCRPPQGASSSAGAGEPSP